MTDLQRRYLGSAIGVACGLLVAAAIIGLLEHPEIDLLSGRSTAWHGDRAALAAQPAGQVAESAIISLHDTPRPVPELRFVDGDGAPASLADFRGKLVLLNIWATWCGPCRKEMPTLDRLQATLGGPDFEVVALSIDRAGLGVVTAFYDEIGVRHLAKYIDESGQAARAINALGLPTTLLVDRQGREIARHIGPAEWDAPQMVAIFRQLMSRESGALRRGAAGRPAGRPDDPPVEPHPGTGDIAQPATTQGTSS